MNDNNNTERETAIVDVAVKYLVRNTRFSAGIGESSK